MEDLEGKYKFIIDKLEQKLAVKETSSESFSNAKVPKMPFFDGVKDDIDSYLRLFERYSTAQKWKPESWAVNLSALLRGRALDVYALLPQEKALDYGALKMALLKRFEKTEDGFRQRLRKCRPEVGETFSQFSVRLGSYLDRWLELSKVNKTYEGLYDMVLRDQFLSMCSKDLLLFLKERIPKSIQEMSVLADQFKEPRHANIQSLVFSSKKEKGSDKNPTSKDRDKRDQAPEGKPATSKPSLKKDVRCFKCDRLGHVASQCPHTANKTRNSVGAAVEVKSTKDAHTDKGSESQGKCGTFTSFTNTTTFSVATSSADIVNTSSCNVGTSLESMPTCDGILDEHLVTVLRDTGCNGVVVRRDLITEDQLTGNHRICVLADGSTIQAPVARVKIDTPYFTGNVEAWCLENPLYSLIIGNIPKARDPKDPDKNWNPNQTNAVVTRQQASNRGKNSKPLCVPKIFNSDISPGDIEAAQKDDETLAKIRSLVGREDDNSNVSYIRKRGIIYRIFQSEKSESGKRLTQLVVPRRFRSKVLSLAHESIMTGHLGVSRTTKKVLAEFFWPGVQADIRRFCTSCDICQRTTPKGRTTKVPLGHMPIIEVPFR